MELDLLFASPPFTLSLTQSLLCRRLSLSFSSQQTSDPFSSLTPPSPPRPLRSLPRFPSNFERRGEGKTFGPESGDGRRRRRRRRRKAFGSFGGGTLEAEARGKGGDEGLCLLWQSRRTNEGRFLFVSHGSFNPLSDLRSSFYVFPAQSR